MWVCKQSARVPEAEGPGSEAGQLDPSPQVLRSFCRLIDSQKRGHSSWTPGVAAEMRLEGRMSENNALKVSWKRLWDGSQETGLSVFSLQL